MPLSNKQLEYLAFAWECFEVQPKIDYDKLARLAKLSNGHCAREMLRGAKKKLKDEYGAGGSTSETTPKGGKNATPSASKKKKNTAANDQTPVKTKSGISTAVVPSTPDVWNESMSNRKNTGESMPTPGQNEDQSNIPNHNTVRPGSVMNQFKRRRDDTDYEDGEAEHEDARSKKPKTTSNSKIKTEPTNRRLSFSFTRPSTMGMGMSMFGEDDVAAGGHARDDEIEDGDLFNTFTSFH